MRNDGTLGIGGVLILALALTACRDAGRDLGDEAEVSFYSKDESASQSSGTVAVTDVRKGEIGDLTEAGFVLDPEEESATPYYIDVEFTNDGHEAADLHDPGAEDEDGNPIPSLTLVELANAPVFDPCPTLPDSVEPGGSATGCAIVLVPQGREIERIYYFPGADDEFLYWRVGP